MKFKMVNEAFGAISIPFGDRGKKFKISKNTRKEDIEKALNWIYAYVPKVINDKHIQEADERMTWAIKFLKELRKKNLIGDYDYKVMYNKFCEKVKSNTELSQKYEPFRIKINQESTMDEDVDTSDYKKKKSKFGWFYTMSPGDLGVPMDRFNNQTLSNNDDADVTGETSTGEATGGEGGEGASGGEGGAV